MSIYHNSLLLGMVLFLTLLPPAHAQDWKTYPYHPAGTAISFPKDDGNHREYYEWWYFNFHLTDSLQGKKFSGMIAIFDLPLPFRILNIANETDGVFTSIVNPNSLFDNVSLQAASDSLELYFHHSTYVDTLRHRRDGSGQMLPFAYELHVGDNANHFDLEVDVLKRPLIVGQDGLVSFVSGDSYYYSYSQLSVNGTVTLKGTTYQVSGLGWFDHQYGSFLDAGFLDFTQSNYEWFSVQLDNGMDFNFWQIFRKGKIAANDSARLSTFYLSETAQDTTSQFLLERTAFWQAPSGNYYAAGWRYVDPARGIDLLLTPVLAGQVVRLFFGVLEFWEGSCTVSGHVAGIPVRGVAFAELIHKYEMPQVQFTNPHGDLFTPGMVSWQVLNPDDGNPLRFALFVSTDTGANFDLLAHGLVDPFFPWLGNPSGPAQLKLVTYSVDSTMASVVYSRQFITSVDVAEQIPPSDFHLWPNYPNPFNAETFLRYSLPVASRVRLEIYDAQGREVATLVDGLQPSGEHTAVWHAGNASSGLYLARLTTNGMTAVQKCMLVR
ncbi:MAG: T9SS type A sorting domain-containing protein [candidate division KSB1 bacterium]|nr:T9SS type A sorting domain-containing protein [candidate division KSB1 bacterium]